MRRSPGITLTAVLLLLGAVLLLWSGVQTLVAIVTTASTSQWTAAARQSLTLSALLLFCLSIWCGATAVGLSILRPWARRSVLALSLLLTLASAATAAMLAFYLKPGDHLPDAAAVSATAQRGLLFFYSLLSVLGACWLYYFSKQDVKLQFRLPSSEPDR